MSHYLSRSQSPEIHQPSTTSSIQFNYSNNTVYNMDSNSNPMQHSESSKNNDLYCQPIDSHHAGSHYSLLNHANLKSPPFTSTSISPISSITPISVPLLSQHTGGSNLLQPIVPNISSVSMTPQLSVNSQLGSNDLLGSPNVDTRKKNNNNNNNTNTNNTNNNSYNNNSTNNNSYNNNSTNNHNNNIIPTFDNHLPELSNVPSRTVYLGNIPSDITPHELLNHVRSGTVESIKLIPSKNCAFISFLEEKSATLFHSDAILKRLTISNHDIKVGWGKPSPVQPVVASCVQRYNATRNVYIGNLPENITENELINELINDLKEYGEIDTTKLLKDKNIAFIHFTSILAAIRCVQSLPLVEKYKDRKIFYGKDRCAFITKTQQHNAAQYLGLNPNTDNFLNSVDRDSIANALVQQSNAAAMIATSSGGTSNLGNRTIYLGNLHPDSTIEEICNVVRGGILQNVRLIEERHVCFITFIDPISAAQFYAMSSLHGLIIHNRKIKIGWGKHSGALPNSINLAVGNGASRNIYIGGLDKIPEIEFNKEKLFNDFKDFGDIEQINFFEERHCCFVNFTNISNAIKAIDGIRNNSDYLKCKINFGKDRCGNTPRQFQLPNQINGGNFNNNSNSNNNNNNSNYYCNNNNNNNNNNHISSTITNNSENNYHSSNGSNSKASNKHNEFFYTNSIHSNHSNNSHTLQSTNENQLNNSNKEIDNSDDDDDDDDDDHIDEAKVRFQPLGITIDKASPTIL